MLYPFFTDSAIVVAREWKDNVTGYLDWTSQYWHYNCELATDTEFKDSSYVFWLGKCVCQWTPS